MRLKFRLGLLVAVLLALPQFVYSQEEDESEENNREKNDTEADNG